MEKGPLPGNEESFKNKEGFDFKFASYSVGCKAGRTIRRTLTFFFFFFFVLYFCFFLRRFEFEWKSNFL